MKNIILWVLAFIITAGSAVYQRLTGPTYPIHGDAIVDAVPVAYTFPRSHGGDTNCPIEITTNDQAITGVLEWKRYKTNDEWVSIPMNYVSGKLYAELPHQPPAGKLQYRVSLTRANNTVSLAFGEGIIVRFKGDVPMFILIPHIIFMFGGMFLSTRTGLEIFSKRKNLKKLTYYTLAFLIIGGFVMGPLVQKFAFGEYWTGWPLGTDLTDNKTSVAVVAWALVAFLLNRSKKPERWALVAAIITFGVFLIPHSLLGSELNYQTMKKN